MNSPKLAKGQQGMEVLGTMEKIGHTSVTRFVLVTLVLAGCATGPPPTTPEIVDQALFMSLKHDYPDRSVCIDFYLIEHWLNAPESRDGQELKWIRRLGIET